MGACQSTPTPAATEVPPPERLPTLLGGAAPSGEKQAEADKERPLVQFARRASQVDCSKPRLLLVSDNLPLFELLIRATKESTVVVPVKYASWGLDELTAAVRSRAGWPCRQFASVGLLDHGAPGSFCLLKSVGGGWLDLEKISGSAELQQFFRSLADYVEAPEDPSKFRENLAARVDLMNCSVYAGQGRALIDFLEELTKTNWAASTNETGHGSDWTLESDEGLGDVAACYFQEAELKHWKFTAKASQEEETHADLLEKYPAATSEEYKQGTKSSKRKQHVVLSTKYAEPWFGLAVTAKMQLLKENFTVYNPNTDNAEAYGCEANDRWLQTFQENLDKVEDTKGFVLQLQRGLEGNKSHVEIAEEELGKMWDVARLSVSAHNEAGDGFKDKNEFAGVVTNAGTLFRAIDLYADPGFKTMGEQNVFARDSEELYEGGVDKRGRRHGRGVQRFKVGGRYDGHFQGGKRNGRGTYRYAGGDVYEGHWQEDQRHGQGTCRYKRGDVYEGQWLQTTRHGQGTYRYKSGDVYHGQWQQDNMHGNGTYLFAHGHVYTGGWQNGKRHGKGTLTGGYKIRAGTWHEGKFQG